MERNKLAIVICNYKKREYLQRCIQSTLDALSAVNNKNYKIYIVDNASSDDSRQYIEAVENKRIEGLCQSDNLGGSEGFNKGISKAIEEKYEYILLLDNDVYLHKKAVITLLEFMEKNKDYGIIGSLILSMDKPDQVQEFGAFIDFRDFTINPQYKGCFKGDFKEFIECY